VELTITHITAGFSQQVISPEKGISLAGYFNDRYNEGIHDDLYTKAIVLSDGDTTAALVVADNALVYKEVVEGIRNKLASQTGIPEESIFVQATHTHNAPTLKAEGSWVNFSPAYLDYFVEQTVAAVREAHATMQPVTFTIGEGEESRVAFCRRYIMRDGTIMTNPPKDSPDIVRPESEIDHYFAVLAVKNLVGKIVGVLVHCTNHVDTVGGNMVTADWPGVLCNYVTDNVDTHPPVILLNGMAGNVNHFNINDLDQQHGLAEAQRVGTIYGQTALGLLERSLQPLAVDKINTGSTIVELPRVKLTDEQIDEAHRILEETRVPDKLPTLHSVDLAVRNKIVLALFAQKQIEFAEEDKSSEVVEVSALRIGELLLMGLPFEPFSEIGMEIKNHSPFKYTFPLELLNGVYGYLGTKEAAERRGGMETFPGVDCLRCFVPEAANMLVDAAEQLAKSLV